MLEYRAAAHGVLKTRSFESSENECGYARLETCAWIFGRRGVARASVRKEIAASHRAQG
jgi:hypothetical protein